MRSGPSWPWDQVACVVSLQGLGQLSPACCSHPLIASIVQLTPLHKRKQSMPQPQPCRYRLACRTEGDSGLPAASSHA